VGRKAKGKDKDRSRSGGGKSRPRPPRPGLSPVVKKVRPHTRRLPSGKIVNVRAHNRRYWVRMGAPISLEEALKAFQQRSKRSRTLDAKSRARVVLKPSTLESGLWRVKPNRYDLEGVDTPTPSSARQQRNQTQNEVIRSVLERLSALELAAMLRGTKLVREVKGYVHAGDIGERVVEDEDRYYETRHLDLATPKEEAIEYLLRHPERLSPQARKLVEKEMQRVEARRRAQEIISRHRPKGKPMSQSKFYDEVVAPAGGWGKVKVIEQKVIAEFGPKDEKHTISIVEYSVAGKKRRFLEHTVAGPFGGGTRYYPL